MKLYFYLEMLLQLLLMLLCKLRLLCLKVLKQNLLLQLLLLLQLKQYDTKSSISHNVILTILPLHLFPLYT